MKVWDVEEQLIKIENNRKRTENLSSAFSAVISVLLIIACLYVAGVVYDLFKLTTEGFQLAQDTSWAAMYAINPNVVAWLKMDGTNINHPVVQGKDNFEYLAKGFDGKRYAGGTLFLDSDNKKDFSDDYNIIHGHHMAFGAMFGDLEKYLNKDFLQRHDTGLLKTRKRNYKLKVIGVETVNAYDAILVPGKIPKGVSGEHVLALATCTDALNDDRTVVFCEMIPTKGRWE